jgi:cell division protease FtsH
VRNFIDRNYDRAKTILEENMDKLHAMADALMKFETIDADQISDIMEGRDPRPPKQWSDDVSKPPSGSADAPATHKPESQPDNQSGSGDRASGGPIGGPAGEH